MLLEMLKDMGNIKQFNKNMMFSNNKTRHCEDHDSTVDQAIEIADEFNSSFSYIGKSFFFTSFTTVIQVERTVSKLTVTLVTKN